MQVIGRALALAALQRETARRFAVVVAANRDMETWERDLSFWCGALQMGAGDCEAVLTLPASEGDPYAGASPHAGTAGKAIAPNKARVAVLVDQFIASPRGFCTLVRRPLQTGRSVC